MTRVSLPVDFPGLPLPGVDTGMMISPIYASRAASLLAGNIKNKKKPQLISEIPAEINHELRRFIYEVLTGGQTSFTISYKGHAVTLPIFPGHVWTNKVDGLRQSSVMIVNKISSEEDLELGEAMLGLAPILVYEELVDLGIDPSDWWATNYVKCLHPEYEFKVSTLNASMKSEFGHILHQEIRLIQPDYILCLGADALCGVLDRKVTLKAVDSKVTPYEYKYVPDNDFENLSSDDYDSLPTKVAKVIAVPHPHTVLRTGEDGAISELREGLKFFSRQLDPSHRLHVHGNDPPLDHRIVSDFSQLDELVYEINETCTDNIVSIDGEWNGSHPQNNNAYMRCLQTAWKPYTSVCFDLAPQTPSDSLRMLYHWENSSSTKWRGGDKERLIESLYKIFDNKIVVGHFAQADLEYLNYFGLNLMDHFRVPMSPKAYRQAWLDRRPCGFDTAMAAHAINETDRLSLKFQAKRRTTAGRYDDELDDWLRKNHGSKIDGYGVIPDELLFKYGNYDTDVTRRIALILGDELDSDKYGNSSWTPYWTAMRALHAIVEINCSGLLLNWDRLQELTGIYENSTNNLLCRLRNWARWPDLNPKSSFQLREFLFGERYNRKKLTKAELENLPEGELPPEIIRLRPPEAHSLYLRPLVTTGKYPKDWEKMEQANKDHLMTPSADKKTIAQLTFFHSKKQVTDKQGFLREVDLSEPLETLRAWNMSAQTLRYVLRPPATDDTMEPIYDDEGNLIYDKGIPACVCSDNRVRTRIWNNKATGRWSSSDPSLQNLGKQIEDKLKKNVLKEDYKYPLRSIFRASPGHVLIEADYIGAELAAVAYMSNDANMLEHVRRNQLPEDNPDYYDIHSHVAVGAFNLDCEPTKDGLESIQKSYLRIISKSVAFGIVYGRKPPAIALGARAEGIDVSVQEAQAIMDSFLGAYPGLMPYLVECAARVSDPGWLANAFGRYRRFPRALDQEQQKRFERQAMNFPIQSCVADAVNRAVDFIVHLRDLWKLKSKLVLQVHDALIMEVPYDEIEIVKDKLLPLAMVKKVPIYSCDLDGNRRPGIPPRYFGIDIDIAQEWGIKYKNWKEIKQMS